MIRGERGEKRRCLGCSTAFFDLNRTPIVCPKCEEVFQVGEPAHSAPRRAGFLPNGTRWRSPPRDAPVREIDAENAREAEAPASDEISEVDDEVSEVGDDILEVDDEGPDADLIKEVV